MNGIVRQVRDNLSRWGALSGGQTVVAAVSGGVDSVVMLHAMSRLGREGRLRIVVAHLDHGLRGDESRRDMAFTEALAASMGLPFEGKRLARGELKAMGASPQEAARAKRYEFLGSVAQRRGAGFVALGHTLDDQAETVVMRLLTGSSLSGLAGIPPKRGIYVRPLITVSRAEIEEYASAEGIGHIVDSTNLERKYLRNRVRLDLIPILERQYNPNIVATVARTASLLSHDDEFMEEAARKAFGAAALSGGGAGVCLDRRRLARLHPAVASRVFLMAARAGGASDELLSAHVDAFLSMARGRRPNASIDLPGGLVAERVYDTLRIRPAPGPDAASFELLLNVPGMTVIEGAGVVEASVTAPPARFRRERCCAWFDYDSLRAAEPLLLRQPRPGDRICPLGMTGSRKLKDIFIDEKVAPRQRRRTPVLLAGATVIWVAGLRQSRDFSVGKGTSRALRLVLRKAGL